MRIRAEAQDDFGVRSLGLAWDVVSEAGQADRMSTELKSEMTSPQQKKVEDVFLWSPALYRIPADSTVELQGFALDYFPKRERARTGSFVIRILSPESHAEMLRQELEALMARIEDVTRLQEKIVTDTRDVKESAKDLPGAEPFSRLTQSHEEQLQNAQTLAELSRQGQDTVREAMKNSLIPEDTIRQWSQTLQQWENLSADKMQEAPAPCSPRPRMPSPSNRRKVPLRRLRLPNRRSRRSRGMRAARGLTGGMGGRKVPKRNRRKAPQLRRRMPRRGRRTQEAREGIGGRGATRGGSSGGSSENGAKRQSEPG